MQPILPITVPVKNVKGVARQCYVDGDGIARCEQPLSPENTHGKHSELGCPISEAHGTPIQQ